MSDKKEEKGGLISEMANAAVEEETATTEIPSAKETGLIRKKNQKKNKNKETKAETTTPVVEEASAEVAPTEVTTPVAEEAKPEEASSEETVASEEIKAEEAKADEINVENTEAAPTAETATVVEEAKPEENKNTTNTEEAKKSNKFVVFLKKNKVKIASIVLALSIFAGGVGTGAGIKGCSTTSDLRNEESVETAIITILSDLNGLNLTNNKIVGLTSVTSSNDEKTGLLRIYVKGVNASGKEYDCSFNFTGDAEKAQEIDDLSKTLAQKSDLEGPKKGSKTMGLLIDYFTEIGEFVEENKETAEYTVETLPTTVLKDGEDNYAGFGALERIYQGLVAEGLSSKAKADEFYEGIEHVYNDETYKSETKFVVDAKTKEATVITEVSKDGIVTKYGFILNVPETAITSTKTSEIKKEMEAYALTFLKADHKTADEMLDSMSEIIMIDGCSEKVFRCANNLINKNENELSK